SLVHGSLSLQLTAPGVFTQPVPGTQASLVHGSLSLQSSAPGVFTQPMPGTQASLVHGSLSLQSSAPGVFTQPTPVTQASLVHGSLSLQSSAPGGKKQPVTGLHWLPVHGSLSSHTMGLCWHAAEPLNTGLQMSVVQTLLSLQLMTPLVRACEPEAASGVSPSSFGVPPPSCDRPFTYEAIATIVGLTFTVYGTFVNRTSVTSGSHGAVVPPRQGTLVLKAPVVLSGSVSLNVPPSKAHLVASVASFER